MLKYSIIHIVTLVFAVLTVISVLVLSIMDKKSIISIVLFCFTLMLNFITRAMEKRKVNIDEKKIKEVLNDIKR